MQVDACIKGMAGLAGVPLTTVSKDLGHSVAWGSNVGKAGRSPALGTVADVADVLGYDLAVIDRETGEAVAVIEPPRRASADDRE